MLDYLKIGENIKHYRTCARLSQKELGSMANISGDYISHIEHGTTKVSLPVLLEIADALNLDIGSLLGRYSDASQIRKVDAQIANVISSLPLEKRKMCLALCRTIAEAPEFKRNI